MRPSVSPSDPPDYGPPSGGSPWFRDLQGALQVPQRGSYLAWEPFIFPLLGAPRTGKMFPQVLDPPVLIPVVAPSTSLIWKKKINNYAQVETPLC